MDVSIAKIKAKPGAACEFSFQQPVDAAACGYEEFGLPAPLRVQGRLLNRGNGEFLAEISWQAQVEQLCGRCGQSFTRPASGQLQVRFSQTVSADTAGEDDIWLIEQDTARVLAPVLNEIWLQAPMQPLCRPDCRGLCPRCGVNLNQQSCSCAEEHLDPRWEKLKNLQQNIEREEN